MRSFRVGTWVAVLCAAAFVGACSQEEPDPARQPSSSTSTAPATSSTTPSASPTTEPTAASVPEPPTLPPEATTPDAAGAAAFVRHWFDLVNYAYATGDTGPLSTLALDDCESCTALISATNEVHESGGTFEGARVTVVGAEAGPVADDGLSLVTTVIDQEAVAVVGADGQTRSTEAPISRAALSYYAQLLDGSWRTFAIAAAE